MPIHLEDDFDLLVVLDVSQWITKIIVILPFCTTNFLIPKNRNVIDMAAIEEDQWIPEISVIHHLETTKGQEKTVSQFTK